MIVVLFLLGCQRTGDDSGTVPTGDTDTAPDTQDTATTSPAPCELAPWAPAVDACVEEAACTLSGSQTYENFGYAVSAGGDGNADGYPDLLVGAPGYDSDTLYDAGRARVYSGAGLSTGGDAAVLGELVGSASYVSLGHDVAWVGDMTGDGVDDLVATARGYDTAQAEAGQVVLVAGSAGGWELPSLVGQASWVGANELSRAGHAVAPAGDTDGDGLADLWVTTDYKQSVDDRETYGGGGLALVRGATDLGWDASLADAPVRLLAEDTTGAAGSDIATGDFDGDGVDDVATSAPYASSYRGVVYALPGSALAGDVQLAEAPVRWTGDEVGEVYGWRLAAGDFDADGADDLVVGVPLSDIALPESGAVVVYRGGAGFFDGEADVSAVIEGTWDHQELGSGLAVGDPTGDGVDDLLLGAVTAYRALVTKGGRLSVLPGVAGGWTDTRPSVTFHGAAVKDYLGASNVAVDLDLDGRDELILATGYANVGATDSGVVYLLGGLL